MARTETIRYQNFFPDVSSAPTWYSELQEICNHVMRAARRRNQPLPKIERRSLQANLRAASNHIIDNEILYGSYTLKHYFNQIREILARLCGFDTELKTLDRIIFVMQTKPLSRLNEYCSPEQVDLIRENSETINSKLARQFISSEDSMDLACQFDWKSWATVYPEHLDPLLDDPLVKSLVPVFLSHPLDFAFHLSLLLNRDFSQELPPLPALTTSVDISLYPARPDWFLCLSAEELLVNALYSQRALLLCDANREPLLVCKFIGKLSALSLQSFVCKDGQTVPAGLWISPVETELRAKLRLAHDHCQARMKIPRGDWAIMRGIDIEPQSIEDFLNSVRQLVDTFPKRAFAKEPIEIRRSQRVAEQEEET